MRQLRMAAAKPLEQSFRCILMYASWQARAPLRAALPETTQRQAVCATSTQGRSNGAASSVRLGGSRQGFQNRAMGPAALG